METIIIAIGYLVLVLQYIAYMLAPILFLWFFYNGVIKPFIELFRKSPKA